MSTIAQQNMASLCTLAVKCIINNYNTEDETTLSFLTSKKSPVAENTLKVWNDLKKTNELSIIITNIENECLRKKSFSNNLEKNDFLKVNVYNLFKNLAKKFHIPNNEIIPCDLLSYVFIQQENKALQAIWKRLSKHFMFAEEEHKPRTLIEIKEWLNDPKNEEQLNSVYKLNLSGLELKVIPLQISKLSQLQELYLEDNLLQSVPNFISKFSELRFLNVKNNILTDIPESICKLSQLQELFFNNNMIETIPESIFKLSKLKKLSLKNNLINSIPESFCKLSQLKNLMLDNNNITTLPNAFGHLSQLEFLYLNNNKIETLPESLGNLSKLLTLELNNNSQIKSLPESLSNLSSLLLLEVKGNKNESLRDSLKIFSQKMMRKITIRQHW